MLLKSSSAKYFVIPCKYTKAFVYICIYVYKNIYLGTAKTLFGMYSKFKISQNTSFNTAYSTTKMLYSVVVVYSTYYIVKPHHNEVVYT